MEVHVLASPHPSHIQIHIHLYNNRIHPGTSHPPSSPQGQSPTFSWRIPASTRPSPPSLHLLEERRNF